MTTKRITQLNVLALIVCAAILTTLSAAGCKRKAPSQPTPGPGQPYPAANRGQGAAGETIRNLLGDSKTSLDQIVQKADSWGPIFTDWVGKPAPDFTLKGLDGKDYALKSYRGRNVLVLFWETTCGPCLREIPDLKQLRTSVGEDKLAMLAISPEGADILKPFAGRQAINYTVLPSPGKLPSPFRDVEYTPTAFFIDAQGTIRLAAVGKVSLADTKAILDTF